ncbi:DUF4235 domain-containing protein [Streptomyces sp. NPDC002990]
MRASKVVYKPVGLVLGSLTGAVAGFVFKQLWKRLRHEEDAPNATDEDRAWREILIAAALQGAVFAAVKAIVDRGGAVVTKRLTGVWPA